MFGFGKKKAFRNDVLFAVKKIFFLSGSQELFAKFPFVEDMIDAAFRDKGKPADTAAIICMELLKMWVRELPNSDRDMLRANLCRIDRSELDAAVREAIEYKEPASLMRIEAMISPAAYTFATSLYFLELHLAANGRKELIYGVSIDMAAAVLNIEKSALDVDGLRSVFPKWLVIE